MQKEKLQRIKVQNRRQTHTEEVKATDKDAVPESPLENSRRAPVR